MGYFCILVGKVALRVGGAVSKWEERFVTQLEPVTKDSLFGLVLGRESMPATLSSTSASEVSFAGALFEQVPDATVVSSARAGWLRGVGWRPC